MSPETTYTMSSSSLKIVNLPKLKDDGSNWITYKERVMNTLTHKGLKRHVTGSARKPKETELRDDGEYYLPRSMVPLSDDQVEDYEKKMDEFAQKQASVREVIYETVSKSTFLQIKNEADASSLWKKLASIFEGKGDLVQADMLTKLHNMMCTEDDDVRVHITDMVEIKEELAGMGAPINDVQFAANIRKSLPSSYRPLLTSMSTAARLAKTPFTSEMLIQAVLEEADHQMVAKNIEKAAENAAMIAATNKSSKGRNKQKKSNDGLHCTNCDRDGHTESNCYAKGGGKEGQQPWKKKKDRAAAATTENDDDEDIALVIIPSVEDDDIENVALAVTSDFQDDAQALSALASNSGIIIDSGATRHFSPDRSKFINFTQINDAPIKAADGRIFNAIGKADIKLQFPMGVNQKPTSIILKNVYYAPSMAFTLISVSCIDNAGFAIHVEDSMCKISTPKPKPRVIGQIPLLRGLYRVPHISPSPPLYHQAALATRLMTITELHQKMGHVNHDDLRRMVKEGMVNGIELDLDSKPEFCTACIQAKAARKPFAKKSTTERKICYGEKVVSDLWGPSPVRSLGGKDYLVCFQDQFTHEEKIYFLTKKSNNFSSYKKYEAWVNVQCKNRIKTLGTD